MNDRLKTEHIEALARMAAQLAGRDPDEHVRLKLADVVAFDDVMWRYPDFLTRAEAAYDLLTEVGLTQPTSFQGHEYPFANVRP
jgi:aromatic ring hydroxylase